MVPPWYRLHSYVEWNKKLTLVYPYGLRGSLGNPIMQFKVRYIFGKQSCKLEL